MAKILVIEDDNDMRAMLESLLRMAGFAVEGITGGRNVANQIVTKGYSLIVTDMELPERSGKSLIKTLRTLKMKTPIVVCSAYVTPELEKELGQYPPIAFVKKPFKTETLVGAVKGLLPAPPNPGSGS